MQAQSTKEKEGAAGGLRAWTALLVGGLALVGVGQFLLDSFAESSTIGHWTQHAILFWSGLMVGAGLLRLFQLGSRSG